MTSARPVAATDRADIDCCTIVSKKYVGQALAMIRSYRKHHPRGRFFVLPVDGVPEGIDCNREECEFVSIDALMIPDIDALRMRYTAVELCVSLRPVLLAHLMHAHGAGKIVHLDADLFFTGEMRGLQALLEKHDIILTPHYFSPLPEDGKRPHDRDILMVGTCNAGFFACRKSAETDRVLSWLADRLEKYSYHRPEQFMFGDQRWLDLIPSITNRVHLLKDEIYNVSSWNMHERPLTLDGGRYLVNGEPMAFYHFSGFRPGHPPTLSVYQSRFTLEPGSPLSSLVTDYQRALSEANDEEHRKTGYAYDRFENGAQVSPVIRRIFEEVGGTSRFPHPFGVGAGSFFEWLSSPSEIAGLQNVHTALHRVSLDAMASFPVLNNNEVKRFAAWLFEPKNVKRFNLDALFMRSIESLVPRSARRQENTDGKTGVLERRHAWAPYQLFCKFVRSVIGAKMYNRLKPFRMIPEGSALLDTPPLFKS